MTIDGWSCSSQKFWQHSLLWWRPRLNQIGSITVIWVSKIKEWVPLSIDRSVAAIWSVRQPAPIHSCCTIWAMVLLLQKNHRFILKSFKNWTLSSHWGWPLRSAIVATRSMFNSSSTRKLVSSSQWRLIGQVTSGLAELSAIVDRLISGCYLVCTSTGSNRQDKKFYYRRWFSNVAPKRDQMRNWILGTAMPKASNGEWGNREIRLTNTSLGQEGRVAPFLFLLLVELLPISKVSKVSFIVGHEKGEELG